MVLFGESHLAPGHLPRVLRERMPEERVLTVLQNVDELYWRAAGERHERVDAVRVNDDVVCVFNSTPLEKYENYRLHLSRWGRTEEEGPDLAPTDLQPDRQPGAIPRHQPLFVAQRNPAEISRRPDAGSLLPRIGRALAPAAVPSLAQPRKRPKPWCVTWKSAAACICRR